MDSQLSILLTSFGINLASNFVYDLIVNTAKKGKLSADDFIKDLASQLDCENSEELAVRIVQLLETKDVLDVNKISGYVELDVEKAVEVTGVSISTATHIQPGTKIITKVKEAERVIGLEIK